MATWQDVCANYAHWVVGQIDASIAAAAVLIVAALLRRQLPPRVRSALLLIALVRLALPPWLRSPWSEALVDVPPIDDTRLLAAAWLNADATLALFAITTAITCLLLARLIYQSHVLAARVRHLEKASAAVTDTVKRLAPGLSIDVRIADSADGPFATGLFRKVIVLPATLIARLDSPGLEAVLAHEVAHHARGDLFWITAAAALKAIVWFNPLAPAIARALVATREDGSDDWAVTHTTRDPFKYAQALLQSARMVAQPHPLAAGAHPMGKRLKRLLDGRANRTGRIGVAGFVVIASAAALCLPGAHMPALEASAEHDDSVIVIKRVLGERAVEQIRQR
jgi:bla regulator protein BlaR1